MNNLHPVHLKAQGLVEYALLIALLAVAIIVTLQLLGVSVADVYCQTVIGLGASSGRCSQAYCNGDFNQPKEWYLPQAWVSKNGKLCTAKDSSQWALDLCSQTSSFPKDYTVTAVGANLGSGSGYGVAFRQQNTPKTSGYTFQYDPGLGGFCFRKWANGNETPCLAFAKAPGYTWYNQPHEVRVDVVGDTFTAYVDNQKVLTARDSSYPSGSTGLRTWDSTRACFDDFTVSRPK